ncbi:hypothetical protein ACFCZ9_38720, partial [Streptomyces sp. NPDC056191]
MLGPGSPYGRGRAAYRTAAPLHPGGAGLLPDCVIAYDGDEPAGYAYGAPAVHERQWWREYLS